MSALLKEDRLVVSQIERDQAEKLVLSAAGGEHRLELNCLKHRESEELPAELTQILAKVVEVIAQGGTVTIGSLPDELTTTVAAAQLGISRPTLMKMVRAGEIASHRVGSHTRLRTADVLAFKRQRLERQRQAFDELRALEEELDQE